MEVSIAPGPIGLDVDEMDIDIDLGPDYSEHVQIVGNHSSSIFPQIANVMTRTFLSSLPLRLWSRLPSPSRHR